MTQLDGSFIRQTQASPLDIEWQGRTLTLGPTAYRPGGIVAELEVREADTVVGYITAYSEYEHGALPARLIGTAPKLVRTLADALNEILR